MPVSAKGKPSSVLVGIGDETVPMKEDTTTADPIVTPEELLGKLLAGGEVGHKPSNRGSITISPVLSPYRKKPPLAKSYTLTEN